MSSDAGMFVRGPLTLHPQEVADAVGRTYGVPVADADSCSLRVPDARDTAGGWWIDVNHHGLYEFIAPEDFEPDTDPAWRCTVELNIPVKGGRSLDLAVDLLRRIAIEVLLPHGCAGLITRDGALVAGVSPQRGLEPIETEDYPARPEFWAPWAPRPHRITTPHREFSTVADQHLYVRLPAGVADDELFHTVRDAYRRDGLEVGSSARSLRSLSRSDPARTLTWTFGRKGVERTIGGRDARRLDAAWNLPLQVTLSLVGLPRAPTLVDDALWVAEHVIAPAGWWCLVDEDSWGNYLAGSTPVGGFELLPAEFTGDPAAWGRFTDDPTPQEPQRTPT